MSLEKGGKKKTKYQKKVEKKNKKRKDEIENTQ